MSEPKYYHSWQGTVLTFLFAYNTDLEGTPETAYVESGLSGPELLGLNGNTADFDEVPLGNKE